MVAISIVIPVYNESKTIGFLLEKLIKVSLVNKLHKEIIIIDDASTDNTLEVIAPYLNSKQEEYTIQYHRHEKNTGKGGSLQTGFSLCTGDIVLIQDADLEYDPLDINLLLDPILKGHADVVYGSRFISHNPHRVLYYWHSFGNKLLTSLSNMFSNINLTDMETGYKIFRYEIIKNIKLKEKRFGIEPELTAKIAKIKGIRIYEVGISYFGRTYAEGKKVNWKDGMRALYCIMRYNLFGD
jgi:glycosyltransferase involved in cell wall biosynthesis